MTLTSILPLIAAAIALLNVIWLAMADNPQRPPKNAWMVPALFATLFLVFSAVAVLNEGATGFWTEHIRNLWGNQIWFDLLLAASCALFFLMPKAKALKMPVLAWGLFVLATGSIGLYFFLARYLYLKARQA
ncbi:MAG TPA: hypothetical protein PK299_06800 [Anaerolineales bacterium]|nr:hypothetical protein [Anaerolineales bacterium]